MKTLIFENEYLTYSKVWDEIFVHVFDVVDATINMTNNKTYTRTLVITDPQSYSSLAQLITDLGICRKWAMKATDPDSSIYERLDIDGKLCMAAHAVKKNSDVEYVNPFEWIDRKSLQAVYNLYMELCHRGNSVKDFPHYGYYNKILDEGTKSMCAYLTKICQFIKTKAMNCSNTNLLQEAHSALKLFTDADDNTGVELLDHEIWFTEEELAAKKREEERLAREAYEKARAEEAAKIALIQKQKAEKEERDKAIAEFNDTGKKIYATIDLFINKVGKQIGTFDLDSIRNIFKEYKQDWKSNPALQTFKTWHSNISFFGRLMDCQNPDDYDNGVTMLADILKSKECDCSANADDIKALYSLTTEEALENKITSLNTFLSSFESEDSHNAISVTIIGDIIRIMY